MNKFKVVANDTGHFFQIGEHVIQDKEDPLKYWCVDMLDWWLCKPEDVESITITTNTLTPLPNLRQRQWE